VISIPDNMDRTQLQLGMPGTATVFADNARVIAAARGGIAATRVSGRILLWAFFTDRFSRSWTAMRFTPFD
jgi:hypothetical protein